MELCEAAEELGIDIDPDGLVEDREEIISSKLTLARSAETLSLPTFLDKYTKNIAILPQVNIFDIYNYLISFNDYEHASFRDFTKMEGYSMAKDGYVIDIEFARYPNTVSEVFAIKSRVKPRTQEKDPITKLKYYNVWLIINAEDNGRIISGYCTCKGG